MQRTQGNTQGIQSSLIVNTAVIWPSTSCPNIPLIIMQDLILYLKHTLLSHRFRAAAVAHALCPLFALAYLNYLSNGLLVFAYYLNSNGASVFALCPVP